MSMGTSNKFLIDVFNNLQLQINEIEDTIEALIDSLDDNKKVYSNEKSKDNESHPAYLICHIPW